MDPKHGDIPRGNWVGFKKYFSKDVLSGFQVFLLALPLCLGVSLASGYPPIAGIFTAIIGGLVAAIFSDAELTIKGPAAGLIVIVIGCIGDFGGNGFGDGIWSDADQHAYRMALAVSATAAIIQLLFGFARGGILGEFFPLTVVQGMLASIGVIIISKQIPVALGVSAKGGPLQLLAQIPTFIAHANPKIALIGFVGIVIMFGWPFVTHKILKRIPASMIVLLFAIPMGFALGLNDPEHTTYTLFGHAYESGSKFLVNVPDKLFSALTTPDFSALKSGRAWYWIMMFAVIGTLESMLVTKAIDLLDPWKRKASIDRDNTAVGIGNMIASFVGGLPMISEVVRSRANIDNGARTRFSNLFHGLFLLLFVASVPALIRTIPLAALASMLVFTGFRLAHPKEFMHVYKIGPEQFVVFCSTIVGVLATDLLIGIAIGILVNTLIHFLNGASLRTFFVPKIIREEQQGSIVLRVYDAAIFSNWIGLKRAIHGSEVSQEVILYFSETHLVDHTVMEKIHDLQADFLRRNCRLIVRGLEGHTPLSAHPHAARKRRRR